MSHSKLHLSSILAAFARQIDQLTAIHSHDAGSLYVQVIVVDEVYNSREVAAMADIARRGVSLVATAHGTSLQSLVDNPILNALVGGKHEVIVGDQQAG